MFLVSHLQTCLLMLIKLYRYRAEGKVYKKITLHQNQAKRSIAKN